MISYTLGERKKIFSDGKSLDLEWKWLNIL